MMRKKRVNYIEITIIYLIVKYLYKSIDIDSTSIGILTRAWAPSQWKNTLAFRHIASNDEKIMYRNRTLDSTMIMCVSHLFLLWNNLPCQEALQLIPL
jgi:hypothetical protein